MRIIVTLRRVRATTVAVEKRYILHILCMCFVALVMQHTKHRRRVILSSVASPAVPYFSTLSYKRHEFWKNVFEYELVVSVFSTSFV
jgi:hypothetical protein